MCARVSSQILNRESDCENGGENGGENDDDNGGEITGGENDGLERIDRNHL
ncbi:hypothetical protein F2Q70_00020561 [Brassica cretica]|uniref:Uncharacterized protein n=1 Tax=Brassica cretica TaxID=69181 RepID=A0A8S9GYB2_BRACR|nr:hypothetical protein F2Q70_00020561 [Brassica cretica]